MKVKYVIYNSKFDSYHKGGGSAFEPTALEGAQTYARSATCIKVVESFAAAININPYWAKWEHYLNDLEVREVTLSREVGPTVLNLQVVSES